tara:strand:+ start:291 stop:488 length:198 start_codon:yes stop_codon:yes gene_type:complete
MKKFVEGIKWVISSVLSVMTMGALVFIFFFSGFIVTVAVAVFVMFIIGVMITIVIRELMGPTKED